MNKIMLVIERFFSGARPPVPASAAARLLRRRKVTVKELFLNAALIKMHFAAVTRERAIIYRFWRGGQPFRLLPLAAPESEAFKVRGIARGERGVLRLPGGND